MAIVCESQFLSALIFLFALVSSAELRPVKERKAIFKKIASGTVLLHNPALPYFYNTIGFYTSKNVYFTSSEIYLRFLYYNLLANMSCLFLLELSVIYALTFLTTSGRSERR